MPDEILDDNDYFYTEERERNNTEGETKVLYYNYNIAINLSFFFGIFGVDRFYMGQIIQGIFKFCYPFIIVFLGFLITINSSGFDYLIASLFLAILWWLGDLIMLCYNKQKVKLFGEENRDAFTLTVFAFTTFWGLDKFYLGKTVQGILKIGLTLLFYVLIIIDLVGADSYGMFGFFGGMVAIFGIVMIILVLLSIVALSFLSGFFLVSAFMLTSSLPSPVTVVVYFVLVTWWLIDLHGYIRTLIEQNRDIPDQQSDSKKSDELKYGERRSTDSSKGSGDTVKTFGRISIKVNTRSSVADVRGRPFVMEETKYQSLALLYAWSLGIFGIDRFYLGHKVIGLLKLFTFGGMGVFAISDLSLIYRGVMRDPRGRVITMS